MEKSTFVVTCSLTHSGGDVLFIENLEHTLASDIRLVSCRVRQTTGFTGKIDPTSNDDYTKMLKSCGDFSQELKKTYTKLSAMKAATGEFAVSAKKLLQTPLPVKYEATAAQAGAAVQSLATVGGGTFDGEGLGGHNISVGQKLESEVLAPMKKWLDTYESVKASLKPVEDLRLELDSRRHTVADLASQVDKYRAKLNKGPDAKVEAKMEETIKTLQHKEAKLTLTLEKFQDASGQLKSNLEKLIATASNTKYYLMVAFKEQAAAYKAASEAIGDVPPPSDTISLSKLEIGDAGTTDDATSAAAVESPVPGSPAAPSS